MLFLPLQVVAPLRPLDRKLCRKLCRRQYRTRPVIRLPLYTDLAHECILTREKLRTDKTLIIPGGIFV